MLSKETGDSFESYHRLITKSSFLHSVHIHIGRNKIYASNEVSRPVISIDEIRPIVNVTCPHISKKIYYVVPVDKMGLKSGNLCPNNVKGGLINAVFA